MIDKIRLLAKLRGVPPNCLYCKHRPPRQTYCSVFPHGIYTYTKEFYQVDGWKVCENWK